ncbi:hypothetical protein G7Y89_g11587 [Cudoniella acicularis]|uniref:Heterokaryon incompatibility domain-containing protein n=1 Tax=Cudoniella acicularis TaxID=354080 RepID=A0A8H4RC30_9HELO|nr:hypothetical protein G7Y89_g11587 [Cudoniella acicularis]
MSATIAPNCYCYQPLLEPDSIRILLLQPARSHEIDLEGSLIHTTLSDCDDDIIEPFTALSYVWGDSGKTELAHVDAQSVAITPTLDAALRDLRDSTRVRKIWADALCIDQSNNEEKAQQVVNMGEVYKTAARTIIHLGPLTPQADRVLEHVPRRNCGRNVAPGGSYATIVKEAEEDLLTRTWFRRVWVFQELVLSRDPWIQCGSKMVRWVDVCHLLIPPSNDHDIFRESLNKGLSGVQILRQMENSRKIGNEPIWDLLIKRRGLGATDPRDMVYAHMGMASDSSTLSQYVSIDYRQEHDVSEVYVQVTRYIIDKIGLSSVFSLIEETPFEERLPRLPSWTPDWRKTTTKKNARRDYTHQRFHLFTQNPHILAHIGYIFDVIAENTSNPSQKEVVGVTLTTHGKFDSIGNRKSAKTREGRDSVVPRHARTGDAIIYLCSCTSFVVARRIEKSDPDLDESLWQKYTNSDRLVLLNKRLPIEHSLFVGVCSLRAMGKLVRPEDRAWSLAQPDLRLIALH